MNAIRATWTNGQIVPDEAVDWPEGSQLLVEPVEPAGPNGASFGLTEDQWRDDPESVAAWVTAVEKIEPFTWAEGEQDDYEQFRRKARQFNLDAVKKQMDELNEGDAR